MIEKPHAGRPLNPLSDTDAANFVYWVGEDLLMTNAARHIGITNFRLRSLMTKGEADANDGINSEFAQLFIKTRQAQAKKITKLRERIETCPERWQALAWILEKCFVEDFGMEAGVYKDLLDKYLELMAKWNNHIKPMDGAPRDVRKLDISSN